MYKPYYRGAPSPYHQGTFYRGRFRGGWPIYGIGGRVLVFLLSLLLAYLLLPIILALFSILLLVLLAYVVYRGIMFLLVPLLRGAWFGRGWYGRGPGRII